MRLVSISFTLCVHPQFHVMPCLKRRKMVNISNLNRGSGENPSKQQGKHLDLGDMEKEKFVTHTIYGSCFCQSSIELNFIEQCWRRAKSIYRTYPEAS